MDCFLDFRKVEILIDIFETWKILSFFSFSVKFWNFLTRFEIWIINFQNKIAQLCMPSGILIKTVTHRLTPCSKRRVTVFTIQLSLSLLQCTAQQQTDYWELDINNQQRRIQKIFKYFNYISVWTLKLDYKLHRQE